jgi:hypothetical protein
MRVTSATEMAGNNAEVEVNVSTEAPTTDAAAAPKV